MEQESGGQSAKMRILEFERKVRMEALSGFQQIKNVEIQIREAPEGGLVGVADGEDAKALRATILNVSATIVEKFSKVIRLLSTAPNSSRSPNLASTAGTRAQEQLAAKPGALSLDGDSPLLSPDDSHTFGRMQISSPNVSPCDTPLSGSGMSEGSPGRPNQIAFDSDDDVGGNPARRRLHDASATADPELSDKPALPKKRKYLPKYQMKQRAMSTGDPANDGPPDDGYTWRKYGQKDIKESAYPRSYYRCTHKTDLGCPSIKMVQRSDEDPNYYDVTYRGHHICPSVEQRTWNFGLAPPHMAIHDLLAEPKGPSSALLVGPGQHHLRTPGQSQENFSIGTRHGPVSFFEPKSTSGVTGTPANSNKKSGAATTTTPTNTTSAATRVSPEVSQIIATRFTPSTASAMQKQEQNIPGNLAGNLLDQDGFNQSRVARDSLFRPGSNLMNLLLRQSESSDFQLEDLPIDQVQLQQQQRETKPNQGEVERTRDIVRGQSLGNITVANAVVGPQARAQQYIERWADSPMLLSFQSELPPAGEQLTSRYIPSNASSEVETSHAQQIRPTAATVPYSNSSLSQPPRGDNAGLRMEMYIPTAESEASEVMSPASPPPFSVGMPPYIIDSPGSHQPMYMDYEFGNDIYYESSHTD